jgi:hypothetical protein
MKIQYVSISPTTTAENSGCYSLTPELLAATGARYSRNNEGLDAIVSKIDFSNTDKSVDGIFKMVDYGHASIADMAPIALFIDDISLFAAYFLWTLAPTAGGQECSTRYIKLDVNSVVDNDLLGIPEDLNLEYWQHGSLLYVARRTSGFFFLWGQNWSRRTANLTFFKNGIRVADHRLNNEKSQTTIKASPFVSSDEPPTRAY